MAHHAPGAVGRLDCAVDVGRGDNPSPGPNRGFSNDEIKFVAPYSLYNRLRIELSEALEVGDKQSLHQDRDGIHHREAWDGVKSMPSSQHILHCAKCVILGFYSIALGLNRAIKLLRSIRPKVYHDESRQENSEANASPGPLG